MTRAHVPPTRSHVRRTAGLIGPVLAAALLTLGAPDARAQAEASPALAGTVVRLGPETAALEATLTDGSRLEISLSDGRVRVNGQERAGYPAGGPLESAWRKLLRQRLDEPAPERRAALAEWRPPADADSAAAEALSAALNSLRALPRATPEPRPTGEAAGAEGPGSTAAPAAPPAPEPQEEDEAGEGTRVAPRDLDLDGLRDELGELRESLRDIGREAARLTRNVALVVHDDYEIAAGQTIEGNVALLEGDLEVDGTVDGDVLVLDGELTLNSGSRVTGDVLQIGGDVDQEGGVVEGEIVSLRERVRAREGDLPDAGWMELEDRFGRDRGIVGGVVHNLTEGGRTLFTAISFFIVLAILGAIPLYFARPQFRTTARTLRHSFGRSLLLGLAVEVLFFPVLLVLTVGILTIPLVPLFCIAVALALLGGYLAAAYGVGEVVAERNYDWLSRLQDRTGSAPLWKLLIGLALLVVLYLVIALLQMVGEPAYLLQGLTWGVASLITWLAFTAGAGAVILSRAGTRSAWASPRGPGGGPGGGPAGGPGRGPGGPGGPEAPAAGEAGTPPPGGEPEARPSPPGGRPGAGEEPGGAEEEDSPAGGSAGGARREGSDE